MLTDPLALSLEKEDIFQPAPTNPVFQKERLRQRPVVAQPVPFDLVPPKVKTPEEQISAQALEAEMTSMPWNAMERLGEWRDIDLRLDAAFAVLEADINEAREYVFEKGTNRRKEAKLRAQKEAARLQAEREKQHQEELAKRQEEAQKWAEAERERRQEEARKKDLEALASPSVVSPTVPEAPAPKPAVKVQKLSAPQSEDTAWPEDFDLSLLGIDIPEDGAVSEPADQTQVEVTPEVTQQPSVAQTPSQPKVEAEPEAAPVPEPQAVPEVEAEPAPEPQAVSEVEAEPVPEPQVAPEPEATEQSSVAETVPLPAAEDEFVFDADLFLDDDIAAAVEAAPEPEPEATQQSSVAETASQPKVEAEPEVAPAPEPQAVPEVEAEPAPEPQAVPEVEAEPAPEPQAVPEPESTEQSSVAETATLPAAEDEFVFDADLFLDDDIAAAVEAAPEPEPEAIEQPSVAETASQPKVEAEPEVAPAPEPQVAPEPEATEQSSVAETAPQPAAEDEFVFDADLFLDDDIAAAVEAAPEVAPPAPTAAPALTKAAAKPKRPAKATKRQYETKPVVSGAPLAEEPSLGIRQKPVPSLKKPAHLEPKLKDPEAKPPSLRGEEPLIPVLGVRRFEGGYQQLPTGFLMHPSVFHKVRPPQATSPAPTPNVTKAVNAKKRPAATAKPNPIQAGAPATPAPTPGPAPSGNSAAETATTPSINKADTASTPTIAAPNLPPLPVVPDLDALTDSGTWDFGLQTEHFDQLDELGSMNGSEEELLDYMETFETTPEVVARNTQLLSPATRPDDAPLISEEDFEALSQSFLDSPGAWDAADIEDMDIPVEWALATKADRRQVNRSQAEQGVVPYRLNPDEVDPYAELSLDKSKLSPWIVLTLRWSARIAFLFGILLAFVLLLDDSYPPQAGGVITDTIEQNLIYLKDILV